MLLSGRYRRGFQHFLVYKTLGYVFGDISKKKNVEKNHTTKYLIIGIKTNYYLDLNINKALHSLWYYSGSNSSYNARIEIRTSVRVGTFEFYHLKDGPYGLNWRFQIRTNLRKCPLGCEELVERSHKYDDQRRERNCPTNFDHPTRCLQQSFVATTSSRIIGVIDNPCVWKSRLNAQSEVIFAFNFQGNYQK